MSPSRHRGQDLAEPLLANTLAPVEQGQTAKEHAHRQVQAGLEVEPDHRQKRGRSEGRSRSTRSQGCAVIAHGVVCHRLGEREPARCLGEHRHAAHCPGRRQQVAHSEVVLGTSC